MPIIEPRDPPKIAIRVLNVSSSISSGSVEIEVALEESNGLKVFCGIGKR